jgi:uncharacterized membrane protein YdfJ with MMPL/SSD domain
MPGVLLVPLAVYAVLAPGAVRLFTANIQLGANAGSTPATQYATEQILRDFPGSIGGVPLSIVLNAPVGELVTDETFFSHAGQLMQRMQQAIQVPLTDFHGPVVVGGACINWTASEALLSSNAIYSYYWASSVNPSNSSMLVTVSLPFDAFSNEAIALVEDSRAAVDEYAADSGYGTAAVFHPMAIEVDAKDLVMARFPWVVLVTLVLVFAVIAARYGAALIPIKLFFTIMVPIISVLGTAAFVFQDGAFDWTGIPSLKRTGGLVWLEPVACFFMLVGFALDYDIFLFSRIYANRKSAIFLDDQCAIIDAVEQTGPVISTAGIIMALAFSGMVAQDLNPFMSQMGFTMIYGVLIDTFVVRPLLVPAFLSMAGSYNWWPGKMPTREVALGNSP